jgi:hypothetical protein
VIAPDSLQAVGDLSLPVVVNDHHEVENARRDERLIGGVALAQQAPQGCLDGVRARVLL